LHLHDFALRCNLFGALALTLALVTACGNSRDSPNNTRANPAIDAAAAPRTRRHKGPRFDPAYGARFADVLKKLGDAVTASKGTCAAIADATGPIITGHPKLFAMLRDSDAPAARRWRNEHKQAIDAFRSAMRPMVRCAKHPRVRALLGAMKDGTQPPGKVTTLPPAN